MVWGGTSSPSGLFKEYLVVITPQTALWSTRAIQPGACSPAAYSHSLALHAALQKMDPRSPPDFVNSHYKVLNRCKTSAA